MWSCYQSCARSTHAAQLALLHLAWCKRRRAAAGPASRCMRFAGSASFPASISTTSRLQEETGGSLSHFLLLCTRAPCCPAAISTILTAVPTTIPSAGGDWREPAQIPAALRGAAGRHGWAAGTGPRRAGLPGAAERDNDCRCLDPELLSTPAPGVASVFLSSTELHPWHHNVPLPRPVRHAAREAPARLCCYGT